MNFPGAHGWAVVDPEGEFAQFKQRTYVHTRRIRFFKAIKHLVPKVITSLQHDAFVPTHDCLPIDWDRFDDLEAFARSEWSKKHPNTRWWDQENTQLWYVFAGADEDHYPELIPVREAVLKWSLDWNLYTGWCRDIALQTLNEWKLGRLKLGKLDLTGSRGGMDINREEELLLLPRPSFPRWAPFLQKRSTYLDELEKEVRESFAKSLILSGLPKANIESDVKAILREGNLYCKRLISYYRSKGYKQIRSAPEEGKHIKWAVQVQVARMSCLEVASLYGTNIGNVSREVHKVLRRIELPPREDLRPGRRKGSKNAATRRTASR